MEPINYHCTNSNDLIIEKDSKSSQKRVIKENAAIVRNNFNDLFTALSEQKIATEAFADVSCFSWDSCKTFEVLETAKTEKLVEISLHFHQLLDSDKRKLSKVLADIKDKQISSMISSVKLDKEITCSLTFSKESRLKMIDFLFITCQQEKLEKRTRYLYQLDFGSICTHEKYALIHAPFLKDRERDLIIRNFFKTSVFTNFNKKSVETAINQLLQKIKIDRYYKVEKRIFRFLKTSVNEFLQKGKIINSLLLENILEDTFYLLKENRKTDLYNIENMIDCDQSIKTDNESKFLNKIKKAFITNNNDKAKEYIRHIKDAKIQKRLFSDSNYWFNLKRIEQLKITTKVEYEYVLKDPCDNYNSYTKIILDKKANLPLHKPGSEPLLYYPTPKELYYAEDVYLRKNNY